MLKQKAFIKLAKQGRKKGFSLITKQSSWKIDVIPWLGGFGDLACSGATPMEVVLSPGPPLEK